jgi:hypothetical protein
MEYSLYETARKTGLNTRNHRAGGWTNPRAGRVKTRWPNGFYACLVDFTSPTQQKKMDCREAGGIFLQPPPIASRQAGFCGGIPRTDEEETSLRAGLPRRAPSAFPMPLARAWPA